MSSPYMRLYGIWLAGEPCSGCSPDAQAGQKLTELKNQQRTPWMPQSPHSPPTRLRRDRTPKRRSHAVLVGSGIVVVIAVVLLMIGMRSESAEQQWVEGQIYGDWTVRYTGYGQVTSNGQRITLEPQAAKDHDTTHGGLVHTIGQCPDPEFSVTVHTEAQLRKPDPNVWEVGWVLWNFASDTQF